MIFGSLVLLTLHIKVDGILYCLLSPILLTRAPLYLHVDSQYFTFTVQHNVFPSFSNHIFDVLTSVFSILCLFLLSCVCTYV